MKLRVFYERGVNVIASGLAMTAQRLPFLKALSPLLSPGAGVPMAAPLTVSFVGTQALTGQSITIVPVNDSPNPAATAADDPFQWAFKTSDYNPRSVKVEIETADGFVEGLPSGLQLETRFLVWFLEGFPDTPGVYNLRLTAYRGANFTSNASLPYSLTLNVAGESSPFDDFVATFWKGEELDDEKIVGPNSDPDGDGMDNALEFVLDLDPTRKDIMPGTFGSDPENGDLLRYEIPLNVLAIDSEVTFEESKTGNPSDWAEVPGEFVTRTDDKIVLSVPMTETQRLYRLKVSL
ncbi:MAG: hypothetical protein ACON38_09135 [Akkermansiaceae bacterium]